MFPGRYYAPHYFAPRYFAGSSDVDSSWFIEAADVFVPGIATGAGQVAASAGAFSEAFDFVLQPRDTTGVDSYISSVAANTDTNFGTLQEMAVGDRVVTAVHSEFHGLLRFDLNTLPVGGTILAATLTLTKEGTGGAVTSPLTLYVRRLTTTAWTQTGVTWNKYDGTNAWTTPGGDYTTSGQDSAGPFLSVQDSISWTNMKTLCDYAIANSAGILDLIIMGVGTGTRYWTYYSSNTASFSSAPKLTVSCSTGSPYAVVEEDLFIPGVLATAGEVQ